MTGSAGDGCRRDLAEIAPAIDRTGAGSGPAAPARAEQTRRWPAAPPGGRPSPPRHR